MSGWTIAFMLTAAGCAVNVAFYVSMHKPVNLAAALFCGAMAVFDLVMAAREG